MERTRDRLIEAAAALLDQGGPAAVTLREVGRATGVSRTAPYRHFADKDELLAAIAARELQSNFSEEDHGDVAALATRYVRWALKQPERFRLTFGGWRQHHPELEMAAEAARGRMLVSVRDAQTQGHLPRGDPERLAALIHALAHGAADLAIAGHLGADVKAGVEAEALVSDLLTALDPSLPRA